MLGRHLVHASLAVFVFVFQDIIIPYAQVFIVFIAVARVFAHVGPIPYRQAYRRGAQCALLRGLCSFDTIFQPGHHGQAVSL